MLSFFFIDRPIFAGVLSIVIVIAGAVAYTALPVEQFPEISPPTVQVTASYPGASAKDVADTVATPIEQQVNGVEGMMYMSSQSTNDGKMTLTVTFKLGTDLDMAQVLVQNRVKLAEPKLPEEVKRLGVSTLKKSPSITLAVNLISEDDPATGAPYYDQLFLSNYASLQLKDVLARIEGVGDITMLGERQYSMRLWLDPDKISRLNLTPGDVIRTVREQNAQVAAGSIGQPPTASGQPYQLTITAKGRLLNEKEFGGIVIKQGPGGLSYLRDVARIELGALNYDVSSTLSGRPTASLAVFQLPGANALATAEAIHSEMKRRRADRNWPQGMEYKIEYDTTVFVKTSIESVIHTLEEAILLVVLVVLVFLQNWRSMIIPILAVPVSLVGTFAVMAGIGFSLNNLSLFGLVLAIGIVVDDAIVVVESVEHHMAHGMTPRDAARRTMQEVTGPILATALVLCAVFVPSAFISGISGQFFRQFAITIAVSTIISTINSLTLSPALCALMLRPHGAKQDLLTRGLNALLGWFFKAFNRFFDALAGIYVGTVKRLLRLAVVVLLIYSGLVGLTALGMIRTPKGFIPVQDKGYLVLNVQLEDAASLQRTERVMETLQQMVNKTEGVRSTWGINGMSLATGVNGPNFGTMYVILDDFEHRHHSADHIRAELLHKIQDLKLTKIESPTAEEPHRNQEQMEKMVGLLDFRGARFAIFGAPPVDGLGSIGGFKMQVQDINSAGLQKLEGISQNMIRSANAQPGLTGVFTTFRADTPQLRADIAREQVKALQLSLTDVNDTLQIYLGSIYVNDFTMLDRNYQVTAQAESKFRNDTDQLRQFRVRNKNGDMVLLGAVVDVVPSTGPLLVNRYNMFPAVAVNGMEAPGYSSGQAIALMEELAEKDLKPAGMGFEWTELTYLQLKEGNTSTIVFGLAVVLVFLVLAAQYESWNLPLAVILVVPMCLLSSVVGLTIASLDINIFTQIAFVVLVGLASKNAILIVEFAKQKQEEGMDRRAATLEACRLRLRPIIMTSLAFILGVVPLVLAHGAGAEMRHTLGVAVFSGMLGVTVFGLFLTPVFYFVVQGFAKGSPSKAAPTAEQEHQPPHA